MAQTPSLNALRAFHAVASGRSMAAAAAELGVTTSAVSRQIRNLEECVGVALLVRNGRGMKLTADGRMLESELGGAFAQIGAAVERLRRPAVGTRLRVVVPPIFGAAWLVPRMHRFRAASPGTDVVLLDVDERVAVSNSTELVISWGCFEDSAAHAVEPLAEGDEVFPVCAPQALGAGGLAGTVLLHYESVGTAWNWPDWPRYLEATGVDGTGTIDGPRLTPALLLDALRRGHGAMLVNSAIAQDDLAAGRMVRPVPESMALEESYCLLISRAARRRPEVLAFRDWLKEEFEACFGPVR